MSELPDKPMDDRITVFVPELDTTIAMDKSAVVDDRQIFKKTKHVAVYDVVKKQWITASRKSIGVPCESKNSESGSVSTPSREGG